MKLFKDTEEQTESQENKKEKRPKRGNNKKSIFKFLELLKRHRWFRDSKRQLELDLKFRFRSDSRRQKLWQYDNLIPDMLIDRLFMWRDNSNGGVGCDGFKPHVYIRAMIARTILEISSYNKLCDKLRGRNGEKRDKELREFCGLDRRSSKGIAPSAFSAFRKEITVWDNLGLVLIFIKFSEWLGLFDEANLHIADATDIVGNVKDTNGNYPGRMAKGTRTNRRNGKSKYFVGYKKHNLVAVVPPTNKAVTLISLIAPANKREVRMLAALCSIGKSLGLDINYIVADAGYQGKKLQKALDVNYGITLVFAGKSNAALPDCADKAGNVVCKEGKIMEWWHYDKEREEHLFKCSDHGNCPFYLTCDKIKVIDSWKYNQAFGPIPTNTRIYKKLQKKRKYIEACYSRQKRLNLGETEFIELEKVHFESTIIDVVDLLKEIRRGVNRKFGSQNKKEAA